MTPERRETLIAYVKLTAKLNLTHFSSPGSTLTPTLHIPYAGVRVRHLHRKRHREALPGRRGLGAAIQHPRALGRLPCDDALPARQAPGDGDGATAAGLRWPLCSPRASIQDLHVLQPVGASYALRCRAKIASASPCHPRSLVHTSIQQMSIITHLVYILYQP